MKTMKNPILKLAAAFSMAVALMVSCGPDAPVEPVNPDTPDSPGTPDAPVVDEAKAYKDSLKLVLYKQAKAMQDILTAEEPVTVTGCRQLQKDEKEGLYEISLSSELTFQVFVGQDDKFTEPITCVAEGDKKYWAYVDATGQVTAFADLQGNKLAMTTALDFDIKDEAYSLVVAEKAFELGYTIEDALQVFECELLNDPQGVLYGVRFDFGNENVKIVYVAEYTSVHFYLPSDEEKVAATELFVAEAGNNKLALSTFEGLDYKLVVPQGWTVSEADENGVVVATVTAPEKYEVDEENPLQLSVVAGDDSFVFSTVTLTKNTFRSLELSATGPVIVPTTGLGKFAYGVCLLDDFVPADVKALAAKLISGEQEPGEGNGISTVPVTTTFAEVLGSDLDSEARYILWVVANDELTSKEFGEITAKIESQKSYLLDAEISVQVRGADALYYGVAENIETIYADILDQIQTAAVESVKVADQNFVYNGMASKFNSTEGYENGMRYDTEFVVWAVPAVTGDYTYTEDDIFSYVIKTNPIVPGGNLTITCGEANVSPSTIKFPVSCPDAAMICYAYFSEEGGRYATVANEKKYELMFEDGNDYRIGDAKSVYANNTDAYASNLNDEAATEYWMYAVAVDAEGKYGEVFCKSATTLKLDYDKSITLTVEAPTNLITASSATFKVTSTGNLSEYIYWVGRATDPFWANSAYCGGTSKGAQKYMALNPDDENIQKCMRKYGPLSEDGTLTVTDMTMETKYIFVILEKGEKYYSPIGYKSATTLAADLGQIVKEGTDRWNQDRDRLVLDWEEEAFEQAVSGLMGYYSFKFSCPTDLTAYVMCASYDYFDEMGLTRKEHIMIEIENWTSRKMDKDHTVDDVHGNMKNEPDYYKNGELRPGQLMSVNDFYVHGSPHEGGVTYFAQGSHGKGNCTAWKNGVCESYERALEKIEYYKSLDPWQRRAEAFGLEGDEAATWAQDLRDAYLFYYEESVPLIYINEGEPLRISTPYATGVNEDGIIPDRVIVMLKDLDGNYYEPMYFEVPNYFTE